MAHGVGILIPRRNYASGGFKALPVPYKYSLRMGLLFRSGLIEGGDKL